MRNEDTVSFGIYSTDTAVEHGVEALRKDGFPNSDISVLFSENPAPRTRRKLSHKSRVTMFKIERRSGAEPGLSWAEPWDG
jgi:hypothetical protein